MAEIDRLEFLESTQRAQPDETRVLLEYQRLLNKILVLPGFEFTATFGFHVLGVFPPLTPIRTLEHILLSLNVPSDVIDRGDPAAGSTADVLEAYQLISESGGLAIAAHINSTHGVMMRGMNFGGQTRIAYTQDKHLAALELTDLGTKKGRGSTANFFNGTKPEYPRRMHLIQGSDAHSLDAFMEGKNARFGVGERATEVNLREKTFVALKELFASTDFSRTRPFTSDPTTYDFIQEVQDEGESLVQSFHERLDEISLHNIIADVCAFANTNGGTVYVGLNRNRLQKPQGVNNPSQAQKMLELEIAKAITPQVFVDIDIHETQGKSILRLLVPYGEERPYAMQENKIYVRDDTETSLAVRDEIVNLVKQGVLFEQAESEIDGDNTQEADYMTLPPRAGVEIAEVEERNESLVFTMRDLRNGNLVKNVTLDSARKLWHYAIKQYTGNPVKMNHVQWRGEIGLIRRYEKGGDIRYDLAQKDGESMRIYYGVTENGMDGEWEMFIPIEEN
jgi:hypothetical protein